MEEFISLITNLYTTHGELILIGGGSGVAVLISVIIFFLTRGGAHHKTGITEDVSHVQIAPIESFHKEGTKESESQEGMSDELIEEEVVDEVELEELIETARGEETEEVIETESIVPGEKIEEEPEETEAGLFSRLRAGLSRTQAGLLGKLDEMLSIRKEIDDGLWDDFEETLVTADLGIGTTMKLRSEIESKLSKKALRNPILIKEALREEILRVLKSAEGQPIALNTKPFVIMVAGVNGVGKTTTIGKLAYKFRKDGRNVMVAAADTFRAAAVEQLEIWANRVGSDFLKGQSGADPSAVAFDAVRAAFARDTDVLIVDTAGRLHTKTNLMEELKKIKRVIGRGLEGAPHETLLVLDATTGQNAIQQAKMFKEAIEITGIVLTKLDGTAKGGVIVAIADELKIPVKFIGIGERLGDLREFKADEFVEALFLTGKETLH
ncbi:MAG: signal recognition particle-docking protein FtsY [Candidatus Dadabacteria bacterium]